MKRHIMESRPQRSGELVKAINFKNPPIKRDSHGCAQTRYCREHPGGGLTITADKFCHQLEREDLAPGDAFSRSWGVLRLLRWITNDILVDFVNVVQARWAAKANGWA